MKRVFLIPFALGLAVAASSAQGFHDFTVKDIHGEDFPMSQLRGKKVMVVNVASRCGLTPQYEQLQALYEKYAGDGFVIVAFPSNDFLGQEPGSDEEIITFCRENYGVTFPVMSKISVTGDDIHPLYRWLTSAELNGAGDAEVAWNFQKFLIDRDGSWVRSVPPATLPDAEEITRWIEEK
ncbi:MAG: glutathione peroxidase [Rikenellaceae bacterium]|nr:glutathione peroxidase [Rikenellaceae bacterium]